MVTFRGNSLALLSFPSLKSHAGSSDHLDAMASFVGDFPALSNHGPKCYDVLAKDRLQLLTLLASILQHFVYRHQDASL
jgi:hypothetical protein